MKKIVILLAVLAISSFSAQAQSYTMKFFGANGLYYTSLGDQPPMIALAKKGEVIPAQLLYSGNVFYEWGTDIRARIEAGATQLAIGGLSGANDITMGYNAKLLVGFRIYPISDRTYIMAYGGGGRLFTGVGSAGFYSLEANLNHYLTKRTCFFLGGRLEGFLRQIDESAKNERDGGIALCAGLSIQLF